MIGAAKAWAKRRWPALRLRTILFGVLLLAAALPGVSAIGLRVYENTLVRQTEAELVAQGAALASTAAALWPGAPESPQAESPAADYRPEPTTVDLRTSDILPERPLAAKAAQPPDPAAVALAAKLEPIIRGTTRITLASVVLLDRRGVVVRGPDLGGDLSGLPEVRQALHGQPTTTLRRNGDYRSRYAFEWLSRASDLRLHHARPIAAGGQVVGVLLLSRSPRALFRGLYEDRGKIALGGAAIFGLLVVMSGLISRGVTRPVEGLSAAAREVAAGQGSIPETPPTAAVEIRQLYEDFRIMAEAIDRRSRYLRDFAAAVSHEFKTPLAGIQGAVELMDDHGDTMNPDDRRRFLHNIAAASERLSRLVSRLLDLARADMAKPGGHDVADLAEVLPRLADGLSDPRLRIEAEPAAGPVRVAAPAATLEAVITALADNSRKAGSSRLFLSMDAGPDEVRLTVADDGEGVPVGDRDRLFEPFFTSRRAEGGTGLGLPISRSLLAASHASIALIDSHDGAAFRIVLPRAP
ncbi:MAG TPA: HAMP domain-containing sensor histidine kinase [Caulobacteraceae bacterium]|jgi:signal transduction histidine kinase